MNGALVAPQEVLAGRLANPACLHVEQKIHLPNGKNTSAGSAPKQFLNQPVQIAEVRVVNLLVGHQQSSGREWKKFFGMFRASKSELDGSLCCGISKSRSKPLCWRLSSEPRPQVVLLQ